MLLSVEHTIIPKPIEGLPDFVSLLTVLILSNSSEILLGFCVLLYMVVSFSFLYGLVLYNTPRMMIGK